MSDLIGKKITGVRAMTKAELENEGWTRHGTAVVLDDETIIYASADGEGNRPGVLFGRNKDGTMFYVSV